MMKQKALEQLERLHDSGVSTLNYAMAKRWINQYMKEVDNEENLLKYELLSMVKDGDGIFVTLVAPHDKSMKWGYTIQRGEIRWKDETKR